MEIEKQDKDLVVSVGQTEVKLALMENHKLIEYSRESSQGHSYSVGDVFLGRVKKLLPALNAAFVDIGDSKEAFVHYLDLTFVINRLITYLYVIQYVHLLPNNLSEIISFSSYCLKLSSLHSPISDVTGTGQRHHDDVQFLLIRMGE